MASTPDTSRALADITDEALFEVLATEVLRAAAPIYRNLVHPGINAAGKTKKSPVDGIGFVPGHEPPHLVLVHHTTTMAAGLARKWLLDPTTVKKRKAGAPDPPPGDVVKSVEIVRKERARASDLRATLVLTTNAEPDETLVRDVSAACRAHDVEVDLWSRSRIAYELDHTPTGQWIRRKHLGIEQQYLSPELLVHLSARSLETARPLDDASLWVSWSLDNALKEILRPVTFVVGGSGSGKTVGCFRHLQAHVARGGTGFVLPHEVILQSSTLEQAVFEALHQLHPQLAGGQNVLAQFKSDLPILLLVEDINRSGQPVRLVEKIARWGLNLRHEPSWRLLCPTWPQAVDGAGATLGKKVDAMTLLVTPMSRVEGSAAVAARAQKQGVAVSDVTAAGVSGSLGDDPLLIALHDFNDNPDPHEVIGHYIRKELKAMELETNALALELHNALRKFAIEMLHRLHIAPTLSEVLGYALDGRTFELLRHLLVNGKIVRLQDEGRQDEVVLFRHDRVRDWLFVEALAHLDEKDELGDTLIEEPYLAEILGGVLVRRGLPGKTLHRISEQAPLALFHAYRLLPASRGVQRAQLLRAIQGWLTTTRFRTNRNSQLFWECLSSLSRTDDQAVPELVCRIPIMHPVGLVARMRNGDVLGGALLCKRYEPGYNAPFRDEQIAHAKLRYGKDFSVGVDLALKETQLHAEHLTGLLRLAGHLGDSSLGEAVWACWQSDQGRNERLDDYLWAFAMCCEESNAERLLRPLCDVWAKLPESENAPTRSSKNGLAVYNVDWAFSRTPPVRALNYLIARAAHKDLRWPIIYMLRDVDQTSVLDLILDELVERRKASPDNSFFFLSAILGPYRSDPEGHYRRMCRASKDHLLRIWRDMSRDASLRQAAFDLWASQNDPDDLKFLRSADLGKDYEKRIIQKRLSRGDRTALPYLVERLHDHSGNSSWWWQFARHVLGDEVIECLDDALAWRRANPDQSEDYDWHMCRVMLLLPRDVVEQLLVKHWDHVQRSIRYIHLALFVSTPKTIALANNAIPALPKQDEAFQYLTMDYGIKHTGFPGITQQEQILALLPYLGKIAKHELSMLAEVCNQQGWFDLRREHLDPILKSQHEGWSSDRAAEYLDGLAEDREPFIEHEIDQALSTGASWEQIRDDIAAWTASRKSLDALRLLARAIEHKGTRSDLAILRALPGMDAEEAQDLIENVAFSVRRRVA